MRIALNAQLLSHTPTFRSGGISRVIDHLLRELARDGRGHRFDVFLPALPPWADGSAGPGWRYHVTGPRTARPALRIAWEQTAFAARLAALRPDLLHSLAYAAPLGWRGPSVVTVYDLSFLRFPGGFNRANRVYLSAAARISARRARRVITISEHSKAEIVRLLGVPAVRVDVAYPAAEERFQPLPAEAVAAFRSARGLPDAFIFSLGTLEPRKNLAGLLAAYAQLPAPRVPLYVAGAAGWRFAPILGQARRLGLERDVHFLGFVAEEELPLWYNAARLFAYPSLYEGFGLPVLEAMACGTPVVASDAASLPEVAGRAAALVPPDDAGRLAREMRRVLEDPALRGRMRASGRIQASRFTWRAMADRTADSYAKAAER